MPFVSITELRVRAPEFVEPVFADAISSDEQARAAPGNRATTELLGEPINAYSTKTMWVDRVAMRTFMTSDPHATSMPRLRGWCDEAHVARWEQESEELPSWTGGAVMLSGPGGPG